MNGSPATAQTGSDARRPDSTSSSTSVLASAPNSAPQQLRLVTLCWLSLILALLPGFAPADDFDDGMRAFERRDYPAALEALRRAAETGDADAQYMLGRLHADGVGVLQNFIDAYHWYNLAAAQGQRFAIAARDVLAERMTPEQIAAAQDKATAAAAAASGPAPRDDADETLLTQIQLSLKRLGYEVGSIDGRLNRETQNAIMAYQAENRLVIDGRPSRDLLDQLDDNGGTTPSIQRGQNLTGEEEEQQEPPVDQVNWRKLL